MSTAILSAQGAAGVAGRRRSVLEIAALGLGAALALWIGARGLTVPAAVADRLSLVPDGAGGLNEIRAQYGGFFLAVGLLSAAGLWRRALAVPALWILAVTFGGVLVGRLVGLAMDGGSFAGYGPTIRILFAVDAVGVLLAATALRRART